MAERILFDHINLFTNLINCYHLSPTQYNFFLIKLLLSKLAAYKKLSERILFGHINLFTNLINTIKS